MRRVFRGNSWLDWVRFILGGSAAVGLLAIGVAEIRGVVDALGNVRHDAVIPCLMTAPIIGVVSAMFLVSAIHRSSPVIELYREGIVCRLVGRVPGFPFSGKIGLIAKLISGHGFKSQLFRIDWSDFAGAAVTGLVMMRRLNLLGHAIDEHGTVLNGVVLAQHELGQPIDAVCAAINAVRQSTKLCEQLPSWSKQQSKG